MSPVPIHAAVLVEAKVVTLLTGEYGLLSEILGEV
jgi:hypothetical protein